MVEWSDENVRLLVYRDLVRDCRTEGLAAMVIPHETGILLAPGEVAVADVIGALLIETTRQPTRYDGGYGGVSFPVIGSLRLGVGRQRGRLVPGDESLQVLDRGHVVVTSRRIVFVGDLRSAEWLFERLLTVAHDPAGMSVLATNDRPLNSGFAYTAETAAEVQFRVELALAVHSGRLEQLQHSFEVEIARHDSVRPVPPS